MLEERDRLSGSRDSPVASEGSQSNLTPGADPNIDTHPEDFNDVDDWDICGAVGGDSVQNARVKRKLLDL